jgi:hypothetical protein
MLNAKPIVKEKENAVDFEFKNGAIKFENVNFKHYLTEEA